MIPPLHAADSLDFYNKEAGVSKEIKGDAQKYDFRKICFFTLRCLQRKDTPRTFDNFKHRLKRKLNLDILVCF
jgi:hypothetical protein